MTGAAIERPAARPVDTSPIYGELVAENAVWGDSFGLETARWYQRPGLEPFEDVTFGRSNAWESVREEVLAVRNGVGLMETTGFAKFLFEGPGARAYLDSLITNRTPKTAEPSDSWTSEGSTWAWCPSGADASRSAAISATNSGCRRAANERPMNFCAVKAQTSTSASLDSRLASTRQGVRHLGSRVSSDLHPIRGWPRSVRQARQRHLYRI